MSKKARLSIGPGRGKLHLSALASVLGRAGAVARAKSLSAKDRHEIAKKAAAASAKVRSAKARTKRRAR